MSNYIRRPLCRSSRGVIALSQWHTHTFIMPAEGGYLGRQIGTILFPLPFRYRYMLHYKMTEKGGIAHIKIGKWNMIVDKLNNVTVRSSRLANKIDWLSSSTGDRRTVSIGDRYCRLIATRPAMTLHLTWNGIVTHYIWWSRKDC